MTPSRRHDGGACARFDEDLSALLLGDLEPAAAAELAAHRDACPRCSEAFRTAIEADRLLAGWRVPPASPELGTRILDAAAACAGFAAELDAWRSGDLPPERAAALAVHAEACPACGSELAVAQRVDAVLAAWSVPQPSAALRARLEHTILQLPARRPALARTHWLALAAAAAILGVATLLLRDWSFDRDPSPATFAGTNDFQPPVDDLVQRSHEIRVRTVRHRQFPSEIGAFDAQPILADRGLRKTGNVFHLTLRRVLSGADVPGDPRGAGGNDR